jgi:hypothetical protein
MAHLHAYASFLTLPKTEEETKQLTDEPIQIENLCGGLRDFGPKYRAFSSRQRRGCIEKMYFSQ